MYATMKTKLSLLYPSGRNTSITLQSWSFQRSVWRLTRKTLSLHQRKEVEKWTTTTSDWQQGILSVLQQTAAVERWREDFTLLPGVPNGRERLETVVFGGESDILCEWEGMRQNIFMFGWCDRCVFSVIVRQKCLKLIVVMKMSTS